ncbi:MAG: argininosuccinate lyase [Thermaerobacter sp.]|nr:argininosuccinate lyase [Thermaerobacter sp.]
MPDRPEDGRSAIWGGRFAQPQDPRFLAYGRSVQWDARLAPQDIRGSLAHAQALHDAGVIDDAQAQALRDGLEAIARSLSSGEGLHTLPQDEDVHGAIERLLGPAGEYLHAGRSRNDQVALDFHLFCKESGEQLAGAVRELQTAILRQAEAAGDALVPGMTHLQEAQPVLFAHHLMAYFWMFERDRRRMLWAAAQADRSPLGAGALAGTGLPLDTMATAKRLELAGIYENSIDAVSDRDFALDLGHAAALCALHLSRLGEEIVLWASRPFGWIQLPDAFASGSSMMPQKKNPDAAELLRGRAGRVVGRLVGLMLVLKGLPLAYVRDLQEDKEALFEIVDTLREGVLLSAALIDAAQFTPPGVPQGDLMLATEIADHLVRQGVPFRQAHRLVGQAVRLATTQGGSFLNLSEAEWLAISPHFTAPALAELLDPLRAVARRAVPGGTAPQRVREQIAQGHLALQG